MKLIFVITFFLWSALRPDLCFAESVVTQPFVSTAEADAFKKKVQDIHQYMKDFETTNTGSDMWLPEGFWDGPHESDIGLSMYKMLFGSSIDYVYGLISSSDTITPEFQNRTLATSYAKLMNSIGIIIVLTVMLCRVVGFFGMRAVDVSYLNPDKEDEGSFIFIKGMFGVVSSFPLPFLGGMSTLQGLTIFVLMIGLGAATSIIRFSVPWIISPNMLHYNYPNLYSTINHVFEAKVCTKALDKIAKKNSPDTLLVIDTNPSSQITKLEARFGHDLDTGITCGTLVLGQFVTPFSGADSDILFGHLVDKAIAEVGTDIVNRLWSDATIESIADQIVQQQIPKDGSFNSQYTEYANLTTRYHDIFSDAIKERIMSDLNTDLGNGESYNSRYVDAIANVGFFGLATFYSSLTVKQNDINEKVAAAYSSMKEPSWHSKDISSSWAWFINLFSFSSKDSDIEYLSRAKNDTKFFIETSDVIASRKTPEQAISIASKQFIEDSSTLSELMNKSREYLAYEFLKAFDSSENGATFYNPLIQLRTMGNSIQNLAMIMTAASFSPVGKAVEQQGKVLKSVIGKDSIAMKLFTLLVMMMLGVGLFFANILPMLPYIMWTIATFTYFSHSVISIIGAGWWGAGFMMSSDRNFTGKTSEGAGVIFTLLVKPSLMTMSFFLSILLNSLFGYLISITIQKAATNAYYGGLNLLSLLAVIAIAGALLFVGTLKNLSLIWEMSDMCQRFIGFRTSIDDRSHQEGREQMQAISTTVAGTVKQSIGSKAPASIPNPIN